MRTLSVLFLGDLYLLHGGCSCGLVFSVPVGEWCCWGRGGLSSLLPTFLTNLLELPRSVKSYDAADSENSSDYLYASLP